MNTQRKFGALQIKALGQYIYALRDPRDRKIFYVGQGQGNRVFSHFVEADLCLIHNKPFQQMSSKIIRILDIWNNLLDVEWIIIAHNLPNCSNNLPNCNVNIANLVESAVYDVLMESQNGVTLNTICPPSSTMLQSDEIASLGATFVNPTIHIENVFVFPIQNAVNKGASFYDATRMVWSVSKNNRSFKQSYAVGLQNAISIGSYEIDKWVKSTLYPKKYEFESPGHPNPSFFTNLYNLNWTKVINVARGYWQRGNYLIVEFDGNGKFRIIRGSKDTKTLHNC